MAVVQLKNGCQKKISEGHPWVYRTQIDTVTGEPQPGDMVNVHDFRQRCLGTGFYNPASMLTVRLLTHHQATINDDLIRQRVLQAIRYRDWFRRPDTDSYRLIFGEADLLPGVIVDQFADIIVMQVLALGMERFIPVIADTLLASCHPTSLILQHEEAIRAKENLPLYRRAYAGPDRDAVLIRENGLQLAVDLAGGQKTGYFLDQKANHAALRRFVAGRRVLDCFSYIGGFALNALAGGAATVTAVDISAPALELAARNAELNGFGGRLTTVAANGFDFLREAGRAGHAYDVIVLDPPAFAKSHSAQATAVRGYKEINLSAFRLLTPGGILATHSCSYHMPESLFSETVLAAARDARRTVRIVEVRRQDFDHPVLAGYPESHYLKSIWLQVIE